jgi:hypothetical protein
VTDALRALDAMGPLDRALRITTALVLLSVIPSHAATALLVHEDAGLTSLRGSFGSNDLVSAFFLSNVLLIGPLAAWWCLGRVLERHSPPPWPLLVVSWVGYGLFLVTDFVLLPGAAAELSAVGEAIARGAVLHGLVLTGVSTLVFGMLRPA